MDILSIVYLNIEVWFNVKPVFSKETWPIWKMNIIRMYLKTEHFVVALKYFPTILQSKLQCFVNLLGFEK